MEAPQLVVGEEVPFSIRIEKQHIFLKIGDGDELSWSLGKRRMGGAWGVGAQKNSAGIWRDVTLTKK